MKFIVVVVFCNLVWVAVSLVCHDNCTCVPTGTELWHVTCFESFETETNILWDSSGQRISVSCSQNPSFNLTELLSSFQIVEQIRGVSLLGCPMPSKKFAEFFENVNLTELYFSAPVDRPLGSVTAKLFDGLKLKKLGLGRNGLVKVPPDLLSTSGGLTFVDLSSNRLDAIPRGLFNSTPMLATINVASNHLRVLGYPLGELEHLESLYLHNNELVSISRAAFRGLKNLRFLDLQGNYLETLDSDVFSDLLNLRELRLFSNRLHELPSGLLGANSRLELLDLHDNPVLRPSWDLVANHTRLRKLDVAACNLSSLPPRFLQNLPSATYVDLSFNGLEKLDEDLFEDVLELELLNLANNRLEKLSAGILRNQRKLKRLDLKSNELLEIGNATFRRTDSLLSLDLSHNRLTQLENPFAGGDARIGLIDLRINNNALRHIDRRAFIPCLYLENLDLSVNRLEAADFQLPQRLVALNMSRNELREMPWTLQQWLQNLRSLDFSRNRIEIVSAPNLQFYSDKVTVDLQRNNISKIDLELEQFLSSPRTDGAPVARLGFNPLDCDCHVRYLLTHMRHQLQDRDVVFRLDVQNLTCASPPSLIGREVRSVSESDLFCEIGENCPHACFCALRTAGFVTEVTCPPNSVSAIPSTAPRNASVLDLGSNNVSTLDGIDAEHWTNLSILVLSNNKLSSLDVNTLPESLTALHLDGNRFERLSADTLDALLARPNLLLWLGNNSWQCECEDPLEPWLELTANVKDAHRMECANLPGTPVATYDCDETGVSANLLVGLVVVAVMLTVVISFAGIAYYKYLHEIRVWLYSQNWCMFLVSESDIDAGKQFDAFISFSQEDMDWVATNLLPGLEQHEPYYRLCVHHRDWLVGEWIPDQIVRSVEESCRTIVVLSDNFIRSVWGRLEFKTAHHQALQDRMNRVIVIVLGEVPPKSEMDPEMRMYVGLNTYLRWEDPWFWKKLRYAMPHKPVSSNTSTLSTTTLVLPKDKRRNQKSKNDTKKVKVKVKTTSTSV